MRVERTDEMIHQFPDGTRVTISQSETRIEHPSYPMIVYEENGAKCLVVMANGALVMGSIFYFKFFEILTAFTKTIADI